MQTRNTLGQFATAVHTGPELELSPSTADIEGLRATLVDFLDGSLPGFGFNVGEVPITVAVDRMVDSLIDSHIDLG